MREMYIGKAVVPHIICLCRGLTIKPGKTLVLDCPKTSILNVAFRIRTTGTINIALEEYDGHNWYINEVLEVPEGEMVWHCILKRVDFRLLLNNSSANEDVIVTVDANLPRRL